MTQRIPGRRGGPRAPGRRTALDGHQAIAALQAALSPAAEQLGSAGSANRWTTAVSTGMSLTGLRTGLQGDRLSSLHESLSADAGRRSTWVLSVESGAAMGQAAGGGASHDDYHAVGDSGLFQMFAHDVQSAVDLTLIAHRVAELALTPGLVARDTAGTVQSLCLPEPDLVASYLGDPSDLIDSPTPAQRLVYGERRRRVPELFDLDYPAMFGASRTPHGHARAVAAQRPFFLAHVAELADRAFAEFAGLTGRTHARLAGHWLDDAEYLLVAQGSLVPVAEAVCDRLRSTRWIRVGVLNLTMLRPFPADLVSSLLAGRKAVTVLERVDQPLAADPPLLREIRATLSRAVENGRAHRHPPHPGVAACRAADLPVLFSGCVGLGGDAVRSGDLVAAVDNMVDGRSGRRQFYLGIDFVRPGTRFPKQQVWQDTLVDRYPGISELALPQGAPVSLLGKEAAAMRLSGLTSAEAAAAARMLAAVAHALDLRVQTSLRTDPGHAGGTSELDAVLASTPIRAGAWLERVTVSLAADVGALAREKPLEALAAEGTLIVPATGSISELWPRLPIAARRTLVEQQQRLGAVDPARPAGDDPAMPPTDSARGAAFAGACCRASGLVAGAAPSSDLLNGIRAALADDGDRDACARAFEQACSALVTVDAAGLPETGDLPAGDLPVMPAALGGTNVRPGFAHGGRFWEQVGVLGTLGIESIADPFAGLGAIPASTAALRDMTAVRTEVPDVLADLCTGCGACWVQCPDAAIPGTVTDVADLLAAAIRTVEADRRCDRLKQISKPLASETRRGVKASPSATFGEALSAAFGTVADKLGLDTAVRQELDAQFDAVHTAVRDLPVAKTAIFFDAHEARTKGSGGLLALAVNPEACRGCRICMEVCEPGAIRLVPQTEAGVATLRRNWKLFRELPETPDRFVDGADDPVASLLLRQSVYQSMIGGGGIAPGAGDRTALHLVLSAVNAFVLPRVKQHVARLSELIDGLDRKARELLASEARVDDVAALGPSAGGTVAVPVERTTRDHLEWIAGMIRELTDIRWRYTEGPGGRGRATCGMTHDGGVAWGTVDPHNPYAFPSVMHLPDDGPALAVGIFEGQMRKFAQEAAWVRRAELELAGEYSPAVHEPHLASLGWRHLTDDEFARCPPVLAVADAGTLLDHGLDHLSRLLASGIPVRVVVLDTPGLPQPLSAASRRSIALFGLAHRDAFILQSSPATPSHLLAGVLRGLSMRRPSVFVLSCPAVSRFAATPGGTAGLLRLALESRIATTLVYDPEAGDSMAERLSLEGNPALDQLWPTYDLEYVDAEGAGQVMNLPVTPADWAATEPSCRLQFREPSPDEPPEALMRLDEYVAASPDARAGRVPVIHVLEPERRLGRRVVPPDVVTLTETRLDLWRHLRQLAGYDIPAAIRARVTEPLEREHARKLEELESQHRARLADIESRYPALVARRLAEGLLRAAGDGTETVAALLRRAATASGITPVGGHGNGQGHPMFDGAAAAPSSSPPAPDAPLPAAPAGAVETETREDADLDESLTMDPYVQSELCTTCDECLNINKRMFAYNKQKQAYIKDPKAGTFRQLVMAAEKCPVSIIHPGTPLDPAEPELGKWVAQAARFQ